MYGVTTDRKDRYINLYTIETHMICTDRQKDTWINEGNSVLVFSAITHVHWEKLKHFFLRESDIPAEKSSP